MWPWPVLNATHSVNSHFGVPRDYDGDGVLDDRHEGIDLYATISDPIISVMSGTVVWASNKRRSTPSQDSLYGWHIIIEHEGDLYQTWYCHLNSVVVVVEDIIITGGLIGYAGSTGNSTGVHLHFNVRKRGHVAGDGYVFPDVVDPTPYLF